jgi:hypothetical protein
MRPLLFLCFALLLPLLTSAPAHAALKAGDAAPEFQARASLAGKAFEFSLKDALKKAGKLGLWF